jgi:hypothetical protein
MWEVLARLEMNYILGFRVELGSLQCYKAASSWTLKLQC